MNITIVHIGGTQKVCSFEGFDAPRPWIRARYPGGGGVFNFSLSHGRIEHKRGEAPAWRVVDADLEMLRDRAREQKIKFDIHDYYAFPKPRAPRRKTAQKNLDLFDGESATK